MKFRERHASIMSVHTLMWYMKNIVYSI